MIGKLFDHMQTLKNSEILNHHLLLRDDGPNRLGEADNTPAAGAVRNRHRVGPVDNIRAVGAAGNKPAAAVDNKPVAQTQMKSSSLRDHHHRP